MFWCWILFLFDHYRHKPQTACEDDPAASAFLPSTTSDVTLEMKACVTSSNEIADSGTHETAEQQPGVPADNETRNSDAHSDDRTQNPSMAGHEVTSMKWKSAIHNGSKKLMADLKYIIWFVLIFNYSVIYMYVCCQCITLE